jgi:hypothetical protein
MNVEIGTHTAQSLYWKYINGILVAVQSSYNTTKNSNSSFQLLLLAPVKIHYFHLGEEVRIVDGHPAPHQVAVHHLGSNEVHAYKVHIYLEYHSVCPLVRIGIGTPTTPSPASEGEGVHTRLRARGWGSPNSDDWRKGLALCLCSCLAIPLQYTTVNKTIELKYFCYTAAYSF